jgi:YbgC/YbaW family acyl-CoA thioester hydrolase
MKLFFRLFWLIVTQAHRSRVDVMDSVETRLRVLPNDLDIFLHVNNGVYLTYADLGRTDLMLRSNTFHLLRQRGWYPVVAAQTIQFKKSLTLWQSFSIATRIVGWDDRAIYMEQIFKRGNTMVARALIDARFLAKAGGRVSTEELQNFLNLDKQSPELPHHVQQWIASNR